MADEVSDLAAWATFEAVTELPEHDAGLWELYCRTVHERFGPEPFIPLATGLKSPIAKPKPGQPISPALAKDLKAVGTFIAPWKEGVKRSRRNLVTLKAMLARRPAVGQRNVGVWPGALGAIADLDSPESVERFVEVIGWQYAFAVVQTAGGKLQAYLSLPAGSAPIPILTASTDSDDCVSALGRGADIRASTGYGCAAYSEVSGEKKYSNGGAYRVVHVNPQAPPLPAELHPLLLRQKPRSMAPGRHLDEGSKDAPAPGLAPRRSLGGGEVYAIPLSGPWHPPESIFEPGFNAPVGWSILDESWAKDAKEKKGEKLLYALAVKLAFANVLGHAGALQWLEWLGVNFLDMQGEGNQRIPMTREAARKNAVNGYAAGWRNLIKVNPALAGQNSMVRAVFIPPESRRQAVFASLLSVLGGEPLHSWPNKMHYVRGLPGGNPHQTLRGFEAFDSAESLMYRVNEYAMPAPYPVKRVRRVNEDAIGRKKVVVEYEAGKRRKGDWLLGIDFQYAHHDTHGLPRYAPKTHAPSVDDFMRSSAAGVLIDRVFFDDPEFFPTGRDTHWHDEALALGDEPFWELAALMGQGDEKEPGATWTNRQWCRFWIGGLLEAIYLRTRYPGIDHQGCFTLKGGAQTGKGGLFECLFPDWLQDHAVNLIATFDPSKMMAPNHLMEEIQAFSLLLFDEIGKTHPDHIGDLMSFVTRRSDNVRPMGKGGDPDRRKRVYATAANLQDTHHVPDQGEAPSGAGGSSS